MSNFIGLVFATLKKEGVDTSKMDINDAIAKYNELKDADGGSSGKGEAKEKETTTNEKADKKAVDKKVDTAKEESTYKLSDSDTTIIDDTIEDGDTKQDVLDKLDKSGFLGANRPQVEEYLNKKMGSSADGGAKPQYQKGQTLVSGDGSKWEITGTHEVVADVHTGRKGVAYDLKNKDTGATTSSPSWYAEKNMKIEDDAGKLEKSMGVESYNNIADGSTKKALDTYDSQNQKNSSQMEGDNYTGGTDNLTKEDKKWLENDLAEFVKKTPTESLKRTTEFWRISAEQNKDAYSKKTFEIYNNELKKRK